MTTVRQTLALQGLEGGNYGSMSGELQSMCLLFCQALGLQERKAMQHQACRELLLPYTHHLSERQLLFKTA